MTKVAEETNPRMATMRMLSRFSQSGIHRLLVTMQAMRPSVRQNTLRKAGELAMIVCAHIKVAVITPIVGSQHGPMQLSQMSGTKELRQKQGEWPANFLPSYKLYWLAF